jgi:hypothetical protein
MRSQKFSTPNDEQQHGPAEEQGAPLLCGGYPACPTIRMWRVAEARGVGRHKDLDFAEVNLRASDRIG